MVQSARAGLLKIVVDALRRAPQEETPVLGWSLICGPGVATRTQATSFTDGILRVTVPDETWRGQLRDLAPQYLAAINKMSRLPVQRIEFVVQK